MSTPVAQGRAGRRWDRRRRQRRQLLAVLAAALLVALVVTVWFAARSPVPPSAAAAPSGAVADRTPAVQLRDGEPAGPALPPSAPTGGPVPPA